MQARRPAAPPLPEPPPVGATLASLRQARSLSLDELSRRAGVSKSMLSQIERAQSNPTVAVVWRLANALGVEIAELLGSAPKPEADAVELTPAHATPALRSPDGQCTLRILGPIELAGRFEWYELTVQPGGALVSQAHETGSREHLSVLSGALEVTAGNGNGNGNGNGSGSGSGNVRVRLGETARYAVDQPHSIRNPGRTVATALLAVIHGG